MIVQAIVNLLKADTDVAAIVGAHVYARLMPDAPTFPNIVVTKVSGQGSYDLQGDIGLEASRVQVDVYDISGYAACVALKTAVRRRLSGYRGPAPGDGGGCSLQSVLVINDLDIAEPSSERAGPRLWRRMIEFEIWSREI